MTLVAEEVVPLWHDVRRSQAMAWRRGRALFGFSGAAPQPRGLLVGEAPGPNTDARLPLFPAPNNSAGGRLLKYADIGPADWLGKLVRMNLCDGPWSARRAAAGRARALMYLVSTENYYNGEPLRVLLLGARVARAWGCVAPAARHAGFGHTEMRDGALVLRVAWIPHPSGRNLLYNDRDNQLRARRAVLWAIGERGAP
ncbi:MAG TPA: hypothetical protein VIU64_10140 [Polyangia bacterium]